MIYTVDGPVRCRPVFDLLTGNCSVYTPERVADLTSVPAAEIRAAAMAIGTARRVSTCSWTGVGQHLGATQTERAAAVPCALTGSFDAPDGNLAPNRQPVRRPGDLSPAQRSKALGVDQQPLGPAAQYWIAARDLYAAILEATAYRVRAVVGFGANPLVSQADIDRCAEAFRPLEFYVHADLFEKPVAIGDTQGRREATRRGVAFLVRKAAEAVGLSPHRRTAIVQGFGNVGSVAAWTMERERGVTINGISDHTAACYDPAGFCMEAGARCPDQKYPGRLRPAGRDRSRRVADPGMRYPGAHGNRAGHHAGKCRTSQVPHHCGRRKRHHNARR
jgi:hypothetical protein